LACDGLGWAAGREIYPDGQPDSPSTDTPPEATHKAIDAVARKIEAEIQRMDNVLDEAEEFEDRPKQVISTTELINSA
jgi:hypothetical protein